MSLLSDLFHRHRREDELDEEVQAHLRMAAQEHAEQGESAVQARASAVREFGNVDLVKEVTRDTWGWRWLESLLQDLRYGAAPVAQESWIHGGRRSHPCARNWREYSHLQRRQLRASPAATDEGWASGRGDLG